MTLQRILSAKQEENARVASNSGGFDGVYGRIKIDGVGQGLVTLIFPIAFIEQPYPFFGHVLDVGHSAGAQYPTWSASVVSWTHGATAKSANQPTYAGCLLSVVVEGSSSMVSHLTYAFHGNALTNPISPSSNLGATL